MVLILLAGMVFSLPHVAGATETLQTIPTRTPTPPPNPTATPGGGGDDDPTPQPTNPPPGATITAVPATAEPTVTTVPAVTFAATPEGGFQPTAAPCSPAPTIQALGRVNVRNGPGLGYTLLGQLSYLEVRPITGRAQFTAWWQIELADGSPGWVSNQFVVVSGYTGQVPVIAPPALADGSTPEPEAQWDPTPNPVCTPLPTSTATRTPQPTATAGGNVTAPTEGESQGETGAIPLSEEPATATEPAPTAVPSRGEEEEPPPAIPVAPTAVDEQVLVAGETPAPTTGSTTQPPAAQRFPLDWLPVAGLGLMAAGAVVYFIRRQ